MNDRQLRELARECGAIVNFDPGVCEVTFRTESQLTTFASRIDSEAMRVLTELLRTYEAWRAWRNGSACEGWSKIVAQEEAAWTAARKLVAGRE